jgi:hypothetical protein
MTELLLSLVFVAVLFPSPYGLLKPPSSVQISPSLISEKSYLKYPGKKEEAEAEAEAEEEEEEKEEDEEEEIVEEKQLTHVPFL